MTDTETGETQKVHDLIQKTRLAMLTSVGPDGRLMSKPMATQDVEFDGDVWFITARDTAHTRAVDAEPRVALTFSSRDAWVALTGRARVVDDTAKLKELWNTFAEAWLPGGPESPEAVLLHVEVEQAEYWDTPGGKIASLVSFAKTRLTGDTYDAEHGSVRP